MKDCTTCKYGYEDERLGIQMCHHPKRFSEDCVDFNMHEEKEIKESEESVSNDLEEAAEKHSTNYDSTIRYVLESSNQKTIWEREHKETFIAGAKWDRQQMMKDAVEKTVGQEEIIMVAGHPVWGKRITLTEVDLKGFEYGDKVRIIIVKE